MRVEIAERYRVEMTARNVRCETIQHDCKKNKICRNIAKVA